MTAPSDRPGPAAPPSARTAPTGDRCAAGAAGAGRPNACVGAPGPAERARTALRAAPTVLLRLLVAGRAAPVETLVVAHATGADGSPVLLLPRGCPVAAQVPGEEDVPAVIEAWSLTPAAVPDRVRAWVRLDGWVRHVPAQDRTRACAALRARVVRSAGPETADALLGPGASLRGHLLRLDLAEVTLADGRGRAVVEPEEFAAAVHDLLVDEEPSLLEHVASAHSREVGLLGALAAHVVGREVERPVVVGVDRFGLRLRVAVAAGPAGGAGEHADVHLPFPAPVRHPGELPLSVAVLVDRARRLGETGGGQA